EAGVIDIIDGVPVINTRRTSTQQPLGVVAELLGRVRSMQPRVVHVFKPKGFGGLVAQVVIGHIPVAIHSDDWAGDFGCNYLARYHVAQRRIFDYQERTLLAAA